MTRKTRKKSFYLSRTRDKAFRSTSASLRRSPGRREICHERAKRNLECSAHKYLRCIRAVNFVTTRFYLFCNRKGIISTAEETLAADINKQAIFRILVWLSRSKTAFFKKFPGTFQSVDVIVMSNLCKYNIKKRGKTGTPSYISCLIKISDILSLKYVQQSFLHFMTWNIQYNNLQKNKIFV